MDVRKYTLNRPLGEPIKITNKTTATLVYTEGWLILVSHVANENDLYHIYRHASYDLLYGGFYVDKEPQGWGYACNLRFYKATEEQRKFFMEKLSKNGFKFVRVLNRLIIR